MSHMLPSGPTRLHQWEELSEEAARKSGGIERRIRTECRKMAGLPEEETAGDLPTAQQVFIGPRKAHTPQQLIINVDYYLTEDPYLLGFV